MAAQSEISRTFAFVFPMASGHINPSLPVARLLVAQGHKVHYLCREQMREAIEDTGATFHNEFEHETELYEGREPDLFGANESLQKEFGLEEYDMLRTFIRIKAVSQEMMLPGILRWLQAIKAEALMYCPLMSTESAYAAKVLGLPSIALLTTAGPGSMTRAFKEFWKVFGMTEEEAADIMTNYQPHLDAVRRLNEKYDIGLDILDNLRPFGKLDVLRVSEVTLVTTSEDLQDDLDERTAEAYREDKVRFEAVGPLLDKAGAVRAAGHKFKEDAHDGAEAPAGTTDDELLERVRAARAAGRRVVFASMGTVITGDSPDFGWDSRPMNQDGARRGLTGRELCQAAWAGFFDVFGAAAANDGPLVVVSLGPQDDALSGLTVPANAVCMPVVPQVDLLKAGVDLFLTHGGQNSFTESLSNGVPMVVCPGFADQPVNAAKAADRGVGLQVPRPEPQLGEEAPAIAQYRADVAEALQRVDSEKHFAEAAQGCAVRLANLGGVPLAARRLVEAAAANLAKGKAVAGVAEAAAAAEVAPRVAVAGA